MTKTEQIRARILELIDVKERLFNMTNSEADFHTASKLSIAIDKIEEAEQVLKDASYEEDNK